MESDWRNDIVDELLIDEISVLIVVVVGVVIVLLFFWFLLLVVGFGLGFVLGGVIIVLSLVFIFVLVYLGRDERKKKVIDEEYNNCKKVICSFVLN